jgi:hypothetical protein
MTIPAELKRSTPRDVSLTMAGWKAILLPTLTAVLIIVGMQTPRQEHVTGALSILAGVYGNRSVLSLGIILLGAVIGWARYRRQANLMMYGRAAVASVTDFERRYWLVLLRRRNSFQCEFRLMNGSLCTTTLHVPRRGKIPGIGEELVILYNRDEPKKVMLYPARMLNIKS